jgi:diacylglycerol kinase family enzyme
LWRYRPREFVVAADGREQRVAAVIVVKGSRYAGNFVVAPAARLDVPLLYAVLFRRPGRLAVLRALAAMALGALDRLPEVTVLAVRALTIAAVAHEQSGAIEIDGEIAGQLPIAIGIAREPLLVVQPPA